MYHFNTCSFSFSALNSKKQFSMKTITKYTRMPYKYSSRKTSKTNVSVCMPLLTKP